MPSRGACRCATRALDIVCNIVNYMTMLIVNIYEAKAKLSEYLEAVARGERVLICKRNQPVAELRAVEAARTSPRPVGGAKGRLKVPAAFFEPLPEDIIEGFAGMPADEKGRAKVAERPAEYGRRQAPGKRKR